MKDEKQTREKLLAAAKEEFLDKGYMKASLRSMCKKAGVTTGALYFFFQDKEDLFAALVEQPLQQMYEIIQKHYKSEMAEVDKAIEMKSEFSEDKQVAIAALNLLYDNFDTFELLINKSQGSRFESIIEKFVVGTQKHYRILADIMSEQMGVPRLSDFDIHWIAHLQIDTYVQYITHKVSREDALKHIDTMMKVLIAGWFALF